MEHYAIPKHLRPPRRDLFLRCWSLLQASCLLSASLCLFPRFAPRAIIIFFITNICQRPRFSRAANLAARKAALSSAAGALVERFDIEAYSDFSAKLSNFIRLVLCCIDAKFCKKIFVGKLLTRSTRFTCFCTAQTSIFQKKFVKLFRIFRQNFAKTRF